MTDVEDLVKCKERFDAAIRERDEWRNAALTHATSVLAHALVADVMTLSVFTAGADRHGPGLLIALTRALTAKFDAIPALIDAGNKLAASHVPGTLAFNAWDDAVVTWQKAEDEFAALRSMVEEAAQ